MSEETERDLLVYKAKLAQQAERYADMVLIVTELVDREEALSDEEQAVFNVAFKNHIGNQRRAWRILQSAKATNKYTPKLIEELNSQVESELVETVSKAMVLLNLLMPHAKTPAAKVFLHKTKADYNRYFSEFMSGEERRSAAEGALAEYKAAAELCDAELAPQNELRLGLALNQSVFYYEILNRKSDALRLASQALDAASAKGEEELSGAGESVCALLRENLSLWQEPE